MALNPVWVPESQDINWVFVEPQLPGVDVVVGEVLAAGELEGEGLTCAYTGTPPINTINENDATSVINLFFILR